MKELNMLKRRLEEAFKRGFHRSDYWKNIESPKWSKLMEKIRERHGNPGRIPDYNSISVAVAYFRKTGEPDGWRGLIRVCYGAAMIDEKGWCILHDDTLREILFSLAILHKEARKRLRCYQALLSSYWTYPINDPRYSASGDKLRDWLHQHLTKIENDSEKKPYWLICLLEHSNLLDKNNPCGRYADKILEGEISEIDSVIKDLGIPIHSWVPEEVILAQFRSVCKDTDARYRENLPRLLSLAMDEASFSLSEYLKKSSMAMLVSRYARQNPPAEEHQQLMDAAVKIFGNPQHNRSSWDAFVVDDRGKPDDAAREMILGWLTRWLMTYFFSHLSEDATSDPRRLNYWLRFERLVGGGMWFALGSNAIWKSRFRQGGMAEFKTYAKGRLLALEDTTAGNNAFIMRIGNYVAIEFGEKGNALYLYRWADLPQSVSESLLSGRDMTPISIHQLKDKSRTYNLSTMKHIDSPKSMVSWEQKIEKVLLPLLPDSRKPNGRPAFIPDLEYLLRRYNKKVDIKKVKVDGKENEVIWIYADDEDRSFNSKISLLGFKYWAKTKNWWKKCEK